VGHRFSLFDIRNALEAVAVRQLILPAIIIVIVVFLGLSEITTKVMILEALMPSAVTVVIYAAGLGLDSELAATVVTLGTFLLLPVIPLLPILLA
jgi:predicted permease